MCLEDDNNAQPKEDISPLDIPSRPGNIDCIEMNEDGS